MDKKNGVSHGKSRETFILTGLCEMLGKLERFLSQTRQSTAGFTSLTGVLYLTINSVDRLIPVNQCSRTVRDVP
jgi:hypothetical protein